MRRGVGAAPMTARRADPWVGLGRGKPRPCVESGCWGWLRPSAVIGRETIY